MTKKLLLIMIFLVFIISLITFILIIKYVNPYIVNNMILFFFVLSFLLSISSFLTFIFYYIKKIHYRGEVLLRDISSSFRQWLFVGVYFLWLLFFYKTWVPLLLSSIVLFLLFLILDFFIQSILA